MNRVTQYKVVAIAAVSIGLLVVTPVCKPVFGSFFGATAANEKHMKELVKKINSQGGHDEDHHDDHSQIKGHH